MTGSKKILLIDDDPSLLDAIQLCLTDEGYEVLAAPSPENILQQIKEFAPDLILMDVLMSGADGRKICRMLKSYEKTKGIPVILISAHPSAVHSAQQYGANAFLAKPFELDRLRQEITLQTSG